MCNQSTRAGACMYGENQLVVVGIQSSPVTFLLPCCTPSLVSFQGSPAIRTFTPANTKLSLWLNWFKCPSSRAEVASSNLA